LVLIKPSSHDVGVTGLLFLGFFLLVAVLAPVLGTDSRLDEVGRRRKLGHS
jgi:hypothetical protein